MKRLHHAGAGGDRDAEQEGEARRRGAVDAAQERGGDRDARARRARDQREGLSAPDREPLVPGDSPQRIAGRYWGGRGAAIGDPHDDRPSAGGDRDDDRPPELRLDELSEEDAGRGARDRGDAEHRGEPTRNRP